MTLDEKLQQLTGAKPEILPELPQCYGARHVSGIARLQIPTFRITNGPVGLGQNDCVSVEVAQALGSSSPMGVITRAYTHPSSAKATALPSALAAAASFDPAVAGLYGEVIATEMHNLGLHVFEAPGVNLARLPILGRNFEYFGEDPFLSGTMAVAETRAIQARGLIAMPKHFLANEQETNRMTIQTTVDRQTLRELYLLPFEMAVKDGKAAAVMCAYNYVNGQPSCESKELLTDILRTDWGFTGYVQTDFFAQKSTSASLVNGLDHEMPLPLFWAPAKLKAALDKGEVTVDLIDRALERRYRQAFKAGIFDRKLTQTPIDFAAGGRKAREIGARSSVLLQNNGALPLRSTLKSLVLIGKQSQVYAQQAVAGGAVTGEPMGAGGGSSDVVPAYTVSPAEGLRRALAQLGNPTATVQLVLVDDANTAATIDGRAVGMNEALAALAAADAVVIMAGTIAEEGADRATFQDPKGLALAAPAAAGQSLDWYAHRSNLIATETGDNAARNSGTTALIAQVLAARSADGRPMARKTALVLKDNAGPALPASLVGPAGPAIVEAWFPGQEDGNIVADVLFGRVEPTGRLPVTVPIAGKSFLDYVAPSAYPGTPGEGGKQTVTYAERLAIGYRWYDLDPDGVCPQRAGRNPCVAFPFGHGLSYTSFAMSAPRVTPLPGGKWRVSARLRNTGPRPGTETAQVYVTLPASADRLGAKQPPRRLVGFAKLALAAGAAGEVAIDLDPAASNHPLGVWDEQRQSWIVPPGAFTLWIGRSSAPRDLLRAGTITPAG
ncbi:glycoside hydrolase family 3 C-terminal domain-containing protein [Novosphingobium piscinae]|uniref:Glycoside hydrolase family 3 C-terminal domain-containing protein n=2 Tax=Novosphingobium piscinae TaxID=1507448 RepID=A0A7X1FVJ7_9SPHN|nr:glycoside hydrolase family 3 C-terminal domain-containing protein [Novosphingobium piscinae]